MRRFTPRNYTRLIEYVMDKGKPVQVGKNKTIEIENMHLMLRNPRDRLVTNRYRKINFPFGIAEWLGMLVPTSRVDFFSQYIKDYSKYSSLDRGHVDGAYGDRLIPAEPKYGQIEGVINELKRDITSRRAVMSIYDGKFDLFGGGGVNTPCTLNLHFLVRRGALDCITTMRSNDAFWGFNYDMIMFTMMQEYIARRLNIPLGVYYHNAGSFHIYEKHYSMLDDMKMDTGRWPFIMHEMPTPDPYQLTTLYEIYADINSEDTFEMVIDLDEYWANLAYAARVFVLRKKPIEQISELYYSITDYSIRRVLRPWLPLELKEDANV